MRLRIAKGALLGLAAGFLALAAVLAPGWASLEENLGLGILFRLRGTRPPPSDVVVVSIDKETSEKLDLDEDCRKWPRTLHARLTENLFRCGAKVIVFDVFFEEPSAPAHDRAFAWAIRNAGNVLLCERLQYERVRLADPHNLAGEEIVISRRFPPHAPLREAAAASMPYPLPKYPVKVSRDWTFRTTEGHLLSPTMPVAAFQLYTLPEYQDFHRLLEKAAPAEAKRLPRTGEDFIRSRGIKGMILALREIFERDPSLEGRMLAAMDTSSRNAPGLDRARILRSLIRLYGGDTWKFLNYYGPTRTIPTIPYYQAVRGNGIGGTNRYVSAIAGKAVFVGSSEVRPLTQKDGFHTVYTEENGVDLSGVEIGATSFANMIDGTQIRPLPDRSRVAILFLWGIVAGILSMLLSPAFAILAVAALSSIYLTAAVHGFSAAAEWYPVVLPILVQAPLVIAGSVAWKYADLKREQRNFRSAFSHYLPADVVDGLIRNLESLKVEDRIVHGVCLATDAEHYTAFAESVEPEALAKSMNRYYEAVFDPVKRHGGMVSNVVGDSMLALWLATRRDHAPLKGACLAAIEISDAMREFHRSVDGTRFPTRIGLHSGEIFLGNIGSSHHFEYRPMGDIVNTATRIEGLNKILGTRILVTREVLSLTDIFLARDMGSFLLVGKSRPVHVFELVALLSEATSLQKGYCESFSAGMEAFRKQQWGKADEEFRKTHEFRVGDGPSMFYRGLCLRYSQDPPAKEWDGVIHIETK